MGINPGDAFCGFKALLQSAEMSAIWTCTPSAAASYGWTVINMGDYLKCLFLSKWKAFSVFLLSLYSGNFWACEGALD